MIKACVLANGEYRHPERLVRVVQEADVVIAADGGANWLAAQGLVPDVLVGDMDSVTDEVRAVIEVQGGRLVTAPQAKDETDLELALLEAVAMDVQQITVLGALGGRIDHALANVQLLALTALRGRDVRLYDGTSYLWLTDSRTRVQGEPGDLVSLIPLGGDVRGVRTQGLAYPLRGETLFVGPARGTSNVMTGDEATIALEAGTLLVAHTPAANLERG
jgi:thiamine pyrophosphokinase